jgi:hypothetical protein
MRIEFSIGVPKSLATIAEMIGHRKVLLPAIIASVILVSVTAWAVVAYTPFEDGQTLTAGNLNTAFQNLYTAVSELQAKPAEVPTGTVVAFMGTTVPTGWLTCDGASYNKDDKPALFTALGFSHGGDGAQMFYLPDLRGRFLRGVDGLAGIDPDAELRLSPQPGLSLVGNQGNRVGSVQEGATALPTNPFVTSTSNGLAGSGCDSGSNNSTYVYNTHSHTITGGGDLETRPTNIYVNWIIKE